MATRTISTSAELVLARNRLRKSFIIMNEDTSINVFIKQERAGTPTVTSTDHDLRIGPGGSIALNSFLDGAEQIQDSWSIVAASGTPRIAVYETEDITR